MPGIGNYDVQYTLILKDQMTKVLAKAETATKGFNATLAAGHDKIASVFSKGNIAMGAVAAGAWVAGKAIKEAMDFEQVSVQMEVLMGSVEKASQIIKETEDFALKSPYGSKDLLESERLLLNFGVAHKKIMPTMKMLGDIAMGDAEKLNRMSLAYGQMSSAGRLMGQDLLQMINAGFNPLQEISKRTGMSMAELRKEMERGNISVQMVEQAFIDATAEGGRFHGMMDKQSETMAGQWSASVEKFNISLRKLGMIGLPMLTEAIGSLNNLMSGNFRGAFESIQRGMEWSSFHTFRFTGALKYLYKEIEPTYTSLHDQMMLIANSSIKQLNQGLESHSEVVETAASLTDKQLTGALDRAQKMYGITSAQIDVFLGKVREQQGLMANMNAPKKMEDMNIEELQKYQEGFENSQKLSTNRKEFLKDQKEIDKIQKRINSITGQGSRRSGGGGGSVSEGSSVSSRAPQYFTINIDQLVGTINTRKESFNESDYDTKKKVTEALTGALNDTQLINK